MVDPRSGTMFLMDRRSPEAIKLKAAVLRKLLQFLADYSDDVLAEYIVVLVCNGKSQTHAREDLRDFLGDDTDHFVSWLWDYLSHEIFKSPKQMEIPKSDGVSEAKPLAAQLSDNAQSDRYQPSTSPSLDCPNTLKHTRPPLPELKSDRELIHSYEASRTKMAGLSAQNCRGISHQQGHQPASDVEQRPVYEYSNQKVARRNLDEQASQSLHGPEKGTFIKRQGILYAEGIQGAGGRMLSTTQDREAHHVHRRRGNVWDRLGKPIEEDDPMLAEKKGKINSDVVKRRKLELAKLPNHSLVRTTADHTGQTTMLSHSLAEQAFQKVEMNAPIEHKTAQKTNKYILEEKYSVVPSPRLGEHTVKPAGITNPDPQAKANSEFQPRSENLEITSLQAPLPGNNSILSISDDLNSPGGGSGSRRPIQDEVLDVKSRLREIELQMLKLRSRQAEMGSCIKPNYLSGVRNHHIKDMDSRTVIVTNVHFAASKEAVVSYFVKCGNIVKVVFLTDTITAQPKGVAYVTFASKESVEKAVMLSGTSFYSRILTVLRKAEAPAKLLVPPGELSGRPSIAQVPSQVGSSLQRHRLQWVRNQPADMGAKVATVSEHVIEASCCTNEAGVRAL